jgi:hypothetical protein
MSSSRPDSSSARQLSAFVRSHVGLVRADNEDRCAVSAIDGAPAEWIGKLETEGGWALIAGGVGGHVAGEVATLAMGSSGSLSQRRRLVGRGGGANVAGQRCCSCSVILSNSINRRRVAIQMAPRHRRSTICSTGGRRSNRMEVYSSPRRGGSTPTICAFTPELLYEAKLHSSTRKWARQPAWEWRPEPESNRRARICSPLRNHSAIGPSVEI